MRIEIPPGIPGYVLARGVAGQARALQWPASWGEEAESPPPDAGEFSKICKEILRKLQKGIILSYFSKLCVKFLRVWTKNTIAWEIFDEKSIFGKI